MFIEVIPNAKLNIVRKGSQVLKVYTTAMAIDGRANKSVILILAEHFNVKKSSIQIIKGLKSRNKMINIANYA